jgi:hypothetical protein
MNTGYICGPRVYRYAGWLFEWHSYSGPWPLRADGELRARAGRRFWAMIARFAALPATERAACIVVRGGCQPIDAQP